MGYRIEITGPSVALAERLRSSPDAIFGKPYAGYMFVLAGSADQPVLDWLSNNLVALDALSGNIFAFAVFAQRMRIKLVVDDGLRRRRTESERQAVLRARVRRNMHNETLLRMLRTTTDGPKSGDKDQEEMDRKEIEQAKKEWEEIERLQTLTANPQTLEERLQTFRSEGRGRVPSDPRIHERDPRILGEVNVSQLSRNQGTWTIERLVKSGQYGWAVSGDELIAVTYGVESMAREFGVTGSLPCAVFVDALPCTEVQVLPLNQETCSALIVLLRRVVQRLIDDESLESYLKQIDDLSSSVRAIRNIEEQLAEAVAEQELFLAWQRQLRRTQALAHEGSIAKAVRSVSYQPFSRQDPRRTNVGQTFTQHRIALRAIGKTLRAFDFFLNRDWPLEPPYDAAFRDALGRHLQKTLDQVDFPVSRESCALAHAKAKELFEEEILQCLSSIDALLNAKHELIMKDQLDEARRKAYSLHAEIVAAKKPQFAKIVLEEAGRLKLDATTRKIKNIAAAFVGSFLDPKLLIEIGTQLAGKSDT